LELEARIFNRTFRETTYNAGLQLPMFAETGWKEQDLFAHTGGNGMACRSADLVPARKAGHALFLSRFLEDQLIAPRQTDTWRASIQPISKLGGVMAAGGAGVLAMEGRRLRIQGVAPIENHKLVLLTEGGQTLESAFSAYPEHVAEFELPEPPAAIALLDPGKRAISQWEGRWPEPPVGAGQPALDGGDWRALDRSTARFAVATRHAARVMDANDCMRSGDFEAAEEALEQALLYDGEDHLAWWCKALAGRMIGEDGESAELLNAHYLAPLEPALRAESFLAQPKRMEKEPSSLLAPMAEHPENFIEVACLLLEPGLHEQAAYWIDEALRHEDLPMLRYLLAYSHLTSSGLEYEAAAQIEAASKSGMGPPLPWREIEWEAIEKLADWFPADSRLQELRALRSFAQP
jgi:hypothetical protein